MMNKITNKILATVMAGCALLLGIGNLVIVNSLHPQNFNLAILHLVYGIAVATTVYFLGTKVLLKSAPYLMGFELLLLFGCPLFAYDNNGAISIGSFSLAPELLAMPVLCLFWAYIKNKSAGKISCKNWIILTIVTLLTFWLTMAESSIPMVFFIIVLLVIMLYLIGVNCKTLTITIIGLVMGFTSIVVAICRSHHWIITDFLKNCSEYNIKTTYHTWISLKTLKHSVFFGQYQFPSDMSQTHHIPNAITDSALVAGCGEFGYLFMIGALLLTAAIICCGIIITKRCENPTEKLLAGGMTAVIALPALTNMLMMFGLLPIGGVTFPLLAYGGSAMIANALALGGMLAVSKETNNETIREAKASMNKLWIFIALLFAACLTTLKVSHIKGQQDILDKINNLPMPFTSWTVALSRYTVQKPYFWQFKVKNDIYHAAVIFEDYPDGVCSASERFLSLFMVWKNGKVYYRQVIENAPDHIKITSCKQSGRSDGNVYLFLNYDCTPYFVDELDDDFISPVRDSKYRIELPVTEHWHASIEDFESLPIGNLTIKNGKACATRPPDNEKPADGNRDYRHKYAAYQIVFPHCYVVKNENHTFHAALIDRQHEDLLTLCIWKDRKLHAVYLLDHYDPAHSSPDRMKIESDQKKGIVRVRYAITNEFYGKPSSEYYKYNRIVIDLQKSGTYDMRKQEYNKCFTHSPLLKEK